MEQKKYKGSLMINGIIDEEHLKMPLSKLKAMAKEIDDYLAPNSYNAGGVQMECYFDLDAGSPVNDFEKTQESLADISGIVKKYAPDIQDDQIEIGIDLYIENYRPKGQGIPAMSYSIHHPEGIPTEDCSFYGEYYAPEGCFRETPSNGTAQDEYEFVRLEDVELI